MRRNKSSDDDDDGRNDEEGKSKEHTKKKAQEEAQKAIEDVLKDVEEYHSPRPSPSLSQTQKAPIYYTKRR